MEMSENLYVGRNGRIFIGKKEEKEIYHYKGSKWANPFKLKEYTLEESLQKYREYLVETGLINDLKELEGKVLGCFCDQKNDCHAKVLLELFQTLK